MAYNTMGFLVSIRAAQTGKLRLSNAISWLGGLTVSRGDCRAIQRY